jgi:hypothetical protein
MAQRSQSRRVDPRTVAILAIFDSLVPIALEIAYTVGNFAEATFARLP